MVCSASSITGIQNQEILNLIKSQLSEWEDVTENSISVQYKLRHDKKIIKKILASYGYFDSVISPIFQKGKAIFNIQLNERYKFDDVLIIYLDQRKYRSGLKVKQVFDLIGVAYDTYTDTKQLADGCGKIANFLKNKGFAFVNVHIPKVIRDKKDKKIKAIYEVELNGKTIIDQTVINIKSKKAPKLLEPFIKNRIPWKDGDIYDHKKLDDMKNEIMSSRIFSGISVELDTPIKDKNDLTIVHTKVIINLEEALLRDISAGLKYGTSEKFGVLFSWTHYNINGKGSSFSTTIDASKENRFVSVKYDKPDLFYKMQTMSTRAFYSKEKESSYDSEKIVAESILWQKFWSKLQVGVGVCVEDSTTIDKIIQDEVEFNAIGIPIGIKFDTTDEYLNPQYGYRCQAILTPYCGNSANMTIFSGKASLYLPFKKNEFSNFCVLALYSKYGAIFRRKSKKIPRDKLFFAGGANSVRGYDYHKLGKFSDVDETKENDTTPVGKPLGGDTLFEIGIEPRFRISENLGFVAFVEGGNVYNKEMENPLKKLLFGYGVGLRVFTSFVPIRIDIAFPVKRRKTSNGKKLDPLLNLYVSIGQAF